METKEKSPPDKEKGRDLIVPMDFNDREDVQRLGLILMELRGESDATALVLRLWLDWQRAGQECRPLSPSSGHGANDPLLEVIENRCQWQGQRGELVAGLIRAGVIRVEKLGGNRAGVE
jgi:hypothetical protein